MASHSIELLCLLFFSFACHTLLLFTDSLAQLLCHCHFHLMLMPIISAASAAARNRCLTLRQPPHASRHAAAADATRAAARNDMPSPPELAISPLRLLSRFHAPQRHFMQPR